MSSVCTEGALLFDLLTVTALQDPVLKGNIFERGDDEDENRSE